MLYKLSSLGALCSPLLLRIPPEWSAGGKGRRDAQHTETHLDLEGRV